RGVGLERSDVHARVADDPQLGVRDAAPGVEQDVEALVRAKEAEEEDDRDARVGERERRGRELGQVRERAVGDDLDLGLGDAEVADEPAAAVLGVHDDRVDAVVEAALRRLVAGPARLAGQDVVRGDGERRAEGSTCRTRTARHLRRSVTLPLVLLALGASAAGASPVLNIGHRGASGYAPEHTFASYDLALKLGADYIEQDVQMTSDGVLVVTHDETLDRTARGPAEDCTGPVKTKTLAQIKRCDAGSWFGPQFEGERIPTLEEVFQRYGRQANYYIETKSPEIYPGMEEALLALL